MLGNLFALTILGTGAYFAYSSFDARTWALFGVLCIAAVLWGSVLGIHDLIVRRRQARAAADLPASDRPRGRGMPSDLRPRGEEVVSLNPGDWRSDRHGGVKEPVDRSRPVSG
jgi:hypothetical protein